MQNTNTHELSPIGGNTKGAEIYRQEMFTQYLQIKKYSEQTREGILKCMRRFTQWTENENIPLTEISYNDIMAYTAHRKSSGIKPVSMQKEIINVKHFYTFLLSVDEVADNPCSNIEIHGIKRRMLYETFSTEELENIYRCFANEKIITGGIGTNITHKRNKVILGLIIYQGIRVQELGELKVSDVNMREGKIKIEGQRRTAGRELKLEAHQVYEMMDYINETRKMILSLTGKNTDKLFTSIGSSERFSNVMQKILLSLRKQEPRIKDIKQIRASVITNWLKVHNIRKAQQMAGHRYVSSTESYQANNMDDLKEDVNRYHPNL